MNTRLKSILPLFLLSALAVGGLFLSLSPVQATTTVSITVPRRDSNISKFPVAASTKTLIGTFAALNSSGYVLKATDATGLRVVGMHIEETDNSSGSAGDLSSRVQKGLYLVANSATNAVTQAHIGRVCFIEDNNTVASSSGTNGVVAGLVEEVTTAGVWVWVGLPNNNGVAPVTVSMTSTNGTAGAAADLAALKAEAENIGDDVRAIKAALILHGLLK